MKGIIVLIIISMLCFGCKTSCKIESKSTLKIDSIGHNLMLQEKQSDSIGKIVLTNNTLYEWVHEEYAPISDKAGNVIGTALKSRSSGRLKSDNKKEQFSKSSSSDKKKQDSAAAIKKNTANQSSKENKTQTEIMPSIIWAAVILAALFFIVLYIKKKHPLIFSFFKQFF
ncbi:hypothetical protein [uncultured Bacteroides sp.]|uniref:hypothetical protein n=1 Tax=uncultured Bacteroides sp. TaxID=162156 RepID=UPI002AA93B45|nr:hypothetical protein [uncultured Bacteroides sp.]